MTNIKCTIKEPHSHLVHGVTFGCEQGADVMDKPKEEQCYICGTYEFQVTLGATTPMCKRHKDLTIIKPKEEWVVDNKRRMD